MPAAEKEEEKSLKRMEAAQAEFDKIDGRLQRLKAELIKVEAAREAAEAELSAASAAHEGALVAADERKRREKRWHPPCDAPSRSRALMFTAVSRPSVRFGGRSISPWACKSASTSSSVMTDPQN